MIPLLVNLIKDLGFDVLQKFLLELKFKPRVADKTSEDKDSNSSEGSKKDDSEEAKS